MKKMFVESFVRLTVVGIFVVVARLDSFVFGQDRCRGDRVVRGVQRASQRQNGLGRRAVDRTEFARVVLLLGLLTTKGDLRGHHALPFGDQRALGTDAILPVAIPFVTFQSGNDAVISASRAFRRALVTFGGSQEKCVR